MDQNSYKTDKYIVLFFILEYETDIAWITLITDLPFTPKENLPAFNKKYLFL